MITKSDGLNSTFSTISISKERSNPKISDRFSDSLTKITTGELNTKKSKNQSPRI